MKYTIWTANGEKYPAFTRYDSALAYMRRYVLGVRRVYCSHWFGFDFGVDELNREVGEGQCCYASAKECREDRDGAYAPKIERFKLKGGTA